MTVCITSFAFAAPAFVAPAFAFAFAFVSGDGGLARMLPTARRRCVSAAASSSSSSSSDTSVSGPKKSGIVASFNQVVRSAKSDPGNVVMNMGAILSLSGFMMSDVMHLRALSVCGSICGITFNISRKPPQYNAVMWGLVFVSVNVYHLYHLYLERTEDMTFNSNEMLLYTCHFQDWGVEPWQFKKLVKLDGCQFRSYKKGQVVVRDGQPLDHVLMVVRGEVSAEDPNVTSGSQPPLYTYRGDGRNGCVIGGTALVDSTVRSRKYPNRITAAEDNTCVVTWDTDKLASVMSNDKEIESAVLHALYVELIQGLRRDRKNKKHTGLHVDQMTDTLLEFDKMVKSAIKDASTERSKKGVWIKLRPEQKKSIRLYALDERITTSQRENLLSKYGWTLDEWDDGAKLTVAA
mmetsp:Transcript_23766/g.51694  ORF Transcript_23766/g.51694 Transcript_23766/m.51694 type:complete len:406 (-) Transcript_23766:79-1296(-)